MFKKAYQPTDRVQSTIDPKTGLTQQSFKDECDINILLEHWIKTGVMPSFNHNSGFFADVSEVPDMQQAAGLIAYAEQYFAQLSEEERSKYETAMDYFEAVLAAEEEGGHMDPLDVNVPTDTKPAKKESDHENEKQDEPPA